MADDRIAEIREWRQHAYEWGSLSKAEATAIDDLLAEIDRQKGFREESERQLQASFEANAETLSQVSRLREQVAQLKARHAAAIKALDEWVAEGNVVAWAMAARSILDGTADDSARVRAALSPVAETEES